MTTNPRKEPCFYGCGREWDKEGDENGFEDCVSAYHKKVEKQVGKDTGVVGRMVEDIKKNQASMNHQPIFNPDQEWEDAIDEILYARKYPVRSKMLKALFRKEIELAKKKEFERIVRVLDEIIRGVHVAMKPNDSRYATVLMLFYTYALENGINLNDKIK